MYKPACLRKAAKYGSPTYTAHPFLPFIGFQDFKMSRGLFKGARVPCPGGAGGHHLKFLGS